MDRNMNFEDLDEETRNAILEKAQYLIDEGFEKEDFETVKQKVFDVVKENL